MGEKKENERNGGRQSLRNVLPALRDLAAESTVNPRPIPARRDTRKVPAAASQTEYECSLTKSFATSQLCSAFTSRADAALSAPWQPMPKWMPRRRPTWPSYILRSSCRLAALPSISRLWEGSRPGALAVLACISALLRLGLGLVCESLACHVRASPARRTKRQRLSLGRSSTRLSPCDRVISSALSYPRWTMPPMTGYAEIRPLVCVRVRELYFHAS